jgi:hypothetical protein
MQALWRLCAACAAVILMSCRFSKLLISVSSSLQGFVEAGAVAPVRNMRSRSLDVW